MGPSTASGAGDGSGSVGEVAPGFEAVREAFDAQLAATPGHSAQLCVYVRDAMVVDLTGGPALDGDAITGVYSVSKGAAAIALGTLVRSGALELDQPVARYWPPFAACGKRAVTVRQLLSHQAGLVSVDGGLTVAEVLDSRRGAQRLAAQRPAWRPGATFGYHGVTIGIFMEELVRRVAGVSLQELYETAVRAPRGIDFYLGLPASEQRRYRPLLDAPGAAPVEDDGLAIHDGLESLAYRSPTRSDGGAGPGPGGAGLGAGGAGFSPENPDVRAAGPAAIGGVGSARGLARLYAAAQGYVGAPLLDPETIGELSQTQVVGHDRILGQPMSFGVVFQTPHPRVPFASHRGFGHDGLGGALAFADPLYGLSFGYIPNPIVVPGGADRRAVELSALARRAARDTTGRPAPRRAR
jgi:CubicO group peptidase (beta-lactamase class C family)